MCGYAFAPGQPGLFDYPNLAMLLLKARLFGLTKDEVFRLEARAAYVALQPLKLSDAPARYSSPYAKASLGVDTRDLSTLSSQNYLALGLLLLFEITGDQRFVDEADRMLDGIAALRGPWCTTRPRAPRRRLAWRGVRSQAVHDGGCSTTSSTDGSRSSAMAPFCSGCNLQMLYVAGYRRMLAREPFRISTGCACGSTSGAP